MRTYFKNLYFIKLKNLKAMDNFLNRYHLPKLNQDQISNLNIPIMPSKIGAVITAEMAQWVRALTALPNVLSPNSSNHMVAHNHL
jgi:predicted transcriptional regulator